MPDQSVAVVTGATGGIGGAVVQRLLAAGYQVLACGRDPAKLQHLVDTSVLGQVHPLGFDVGSVEAWVMTVPTALRMLGAPRLLVCAQGAAPCVRPTLGLTSADVEQVWRTDVLGTLLACQTVGRAMIAQRCGCIVLVSSMHALATYPQRTAYSMAKSAVCGLARALAVEWAPYGISVNALAPGQVEGPRTQGFADRAYAATGEDLLAAMQSRSPAYKLVEPEAIAETVLWLARTPAVTGATIPIDYGVLASSWCKPFKPLKPFPPEVPDAS